MRRDTRSVQKYFTYLMYAQVNELAWIPGRGWTSPQQFQSTLWYDVPPVWPWNHINAGLWHDPLKVLPDNQAQIGS